MFCSLHRPNLSGRDSRRADSLEHFSARAPPPADLCRNPRVIASLIGYVPKTLEPWGPTMDRFEDEREDFDAERRALTRVRPESKIWAAVDNETRNDLLGMAEVAAFSG